MAAATKTSVETEEEPTPPPSKHPRELITENATSLCFTLRTVDRWASPQNSNVCFNLLPIMSPLRSPNQTAIKPPSLQTKIKTSASTATMVGGNGITLVFDFDKTIIELDSDNWVVDQLHFTHLFNQLLPTMPWNSLMDRMMKELHSRGKTIEDVEKVLKRVPVHPKMVSTIKTVRQLGCELRIVSDANLFFIETILSHLGVRDDFSEIKTNPSFVDEEGKLRILPFHDFHQSSHGCSLCPPNMCKGIIIKKIKESISGERKKRLIYLGDGCGDYCPSLKLNDEDIVMPRKNLPLWKLIGENPSLVKAQVNEWVDGDSLERLLPKVVAAISVGEINGPC